jgi:hypothetical protein
MANLSSSTIFGDLEVTGRMRASGTPGIASFTSTDTSTNINQSSWTTIPWDVQKLIDTPYAHDPSGSPGQITFTESGVYHVDTTIAYDVTSYRSNPGIRFSINGNGRNARGLSGYARDATGHHEASNHLAETISVSAGDTLRVQTYQYANNGTATMKNKESVLTITARSVSAYETDTADTVDGYHGSDFVQSGGDTMTGSLNMGGNDIYDGSRSYVGINDDLRLTGELNENSSL